MYEVLKSIFSEIVSREWPKILATVLFVLLGSIATLLMGWILKSLANEELEGSFSMLIFSIVALGIGTGGRIWASKNLIGEFVFDLRRRIYDAIIRADMAFHNREDTGYLNNLFQDISWMEGVLNSLIIFFIRNISLLIGSLVLMIYIDPVLSFYVICGVTLLTFFYSRLVRHHVKKQMVAYKNKMDRLSLSTLDTWRGIEVVKTFNMVEIFQDRFAKSAEEIHRLLQKAIKLQSVSAAITVIAIALFFLGILYFSMERMEGGEATSGDLIAFFFYLLVMIGALASSGENIYNLQEFGLVLAKLGKFLDKNSIVSGGRKLPLLLEPKKKVCVQLEKVSLAYDERNSVLTDLSFEVLQGEKAAIMGISGSGKTSILKIIARLYPPSKGRVRLSEDQVALAGQNPVIFNASLWENLACSSKNVSREKAEQILHKLELGYLIKRVGWKGVLGEGGATLSGGEKQRLALARALLSKRRILLLDEITASLDIKIQKSSLGFIFEEARDCTVIFATHSIPLVERCDKIILIHKGKLIDAGSRKEVSKSKRYLDFINLQSFLEN